MSFKVTPLNLLVLFFAGSIGALARFCIIEVISFICNKTENFSFPHYTFVVNICAGFLIGLFASMLKFTPPYSNTYLEVILFTGCLSAFSTFSTYIADIAEHLRTKQYVFTLFYSIGTIFFTLLAGIGGRYLGGCLCW